MSSCKQCGVEFKRLRDRQVYCSRRCRFIFNDRVYRQRQIDKFQTCQPQTCNQQAVKPKCLSCGAAVIGTTAHQLYCCRGCYPKYVGKDVVNYQLQAFCAGTSQ